MDPKAYTAHRRASTVLELQLSDEVCRNVDAGAANQAKGWRLPPPRTHACAARARRHMRSSAFLGIWFIPEALVCRCENVICWCVQMSARAQRLCVSLREAGGEVTKV